LTSVFVEGTLRIGRVSALPERDRSPQSFELADLKVFDRGRTVLSPLRYPGGKRRLVPYVAAALKENDLRPELLVEPFAGGASVALELLAYGFVERIALGDLDPFVAAFWNTVFEDTEWLCRQVESVSLDVETWERMKTTNFRGRRNQALACLYLNRTSFNGALHRRAGPIGGKSGGSSYEIGCRFPRERIVQRIRACAALGNRVELVVAADAMEVVKTTRELARRSGWEIFCYLDPPFWAKSQYLYRRTFTRKGHERFAESLRWLGDPYLLSYDPAPEIAALYAHDELLVQEIELLYSGRPTGGIRELVITNLPELPSETRLWRTSAEWRSHRRAAS
jgi:DNA adenine methylase